MNITIDKGTLLKSINIADSIISAKNINTILSNCLFNITNDEIEVVSTDNEIAVRTRINAVADNATSFTANGKKFSTLLKELPNDEILLNINNSMQIDIKTKSKEVKGHYKLIGTEADEYPEIPVFNNANAIELEQPALKEIIKKVIYAASTDTIKPVFNGLYMVSDSNNNLTTVATDSRRLTLISRNIDNMFELSDGIIIPLKTVHEVFRLLESSGTCQFAVENNQCFFKIGNTEIISRLIDGQFPNYKQVVPKDHSVDITIETRKFLDSVKRAMIFTREPAYKIVLHFSKEKLTIEANTPELGEAEEELAIESNDSDKISIGINAQFLIDSLREIDCDTLSCGITGQMSPITLVPADDPNFISVIMPIQIKGNE